MAAAGRVGTFESTLPITSLTLGQFRGGKAVRVVALFALVPILFAGIYLLDDSVATRTEYLNALFLQIVAPTVLPIATLILATTAIGNEIEDRTMIYLVLKPIRRLRIILEKYLAVVLTGTLVLGAGSLVAAALVLGGDTTGHPRSIIALLVATLVGVAGYGGLFMAVSLLIPRALLVGIMYTVIWESLFARFIPGIRLVSVRHYTQSVYYRIADTREVDVRQAFQLVPALLVIAALVVLVLGLATWRLRTMNLE